MLIEEEDKDDERIPIGLTEVALSIQMGFLLDALKGVGFIEKYETVKGEQGESEIHVYPKKLKHIEFVAERITTEIQGRNRTVKFIKTRRRARLRELIKLANQ